MTSTQKQYRTIWLSDIHLGTRGCKAEFLLDFLKHHDSEYLYLAGDIVDGWRLKNGWFWPQSHNDVVQKILRKARKGTKVFYIPGNHDEFVRGFTDISLGDIEITNEQIHVTADNRRLLVIHGDQFDGVIQYAKWLAHLGDWAYELILTLNHYYNVIRRKLGYRYWSLSAYLKHRVKNAVSFIGAFEETLAEEARRRGFDGVVCGHIHKAEVRYVGDILYCNDGDWVESCTALAEDQDGQLFIIQWTDDQKVFDTQYAQKNSHSQRHMATTD